VAAAGRASSNDQPCDPRPARPLYQRPILTLTNVNPPPPPPNDLARKSPNQSVIRSYKLQLVLFELADILGRAGAARNLDAPAAASADQLLSSVARSYAGSEWTCAGLGHRSHKQQQRLRRRRRHHRRRPEADEQAADEEKSDDGGLEHEHGAGRLRSSRSQSWSSSNSDA
jgi:hypothetical protein